MPEVFVNLDSLEEERGESLHRDQSIGRLGLALERSMAPPPSLPGKGDHGVQAPAVSRNPNAQPQPLDAILITDSKGKIRFVNPAFTRLTGYSSEELLGQNPRILKSGCQPVLFYHDLWDTIRAGNLWRGEITNRRKDGSFYRQQMQISPLQGSANEATSYIALVREVVPSQDTAERNALLAAIVDSAADATIAMGFDGVVAAWNHGAEALFGYPNREIIGKDICGFAPFDHSAELRRCLAVPGREKSTFDMVWQGKEGEKHHVLTSLSPIRNPRGEVSGVSLIARDIRERVAAEEKLREAEERYREVYEHAPFGMCVTEWNGRFIQVNAALCQMLGYTAEELLETSWGKLTHPDDLASSLQMKEQLQKNPDQFVEAEKRYIHRSGRVVWVRIRISAMFPGGTTEPYYVVHLEDITDRKRAEDALQGSEEKFRQLAENIHEVFWIMPPEANELLYVSPAYEQIWGRSCESLYRNPSSWKEAIHPEDVERARLLFVRQMQGEAIESEYRIRTPGGREKWILDRAAPVRDESGRLIRVVGVAEDITERKRYQEALIRARKKADARSSVLERINRREPLHDVLGGIASLLRQQFPDSDCFIHLNVGRDYLELVPQTCSSLHLTERWARVAIRNSPEICARAANTAKRTIDRGAQRGYSWPVLDARQQILGTISLFPCHEDLPDAISETLDLSSQLMALAIDNYRLYDELSHQSQHDSLTGLPNRLFLDEYLASVVGSACDLTINFAVAYIDLDEFKKVNDIYGHNTGDVFLQIAAARLESVLTESEVLARIGGDEFIAVLAGVENRDEARRRGQSLLDSLAGPFVIHDSLRLTCTASVGVAVFPEDGTSIEDLKRHADESMYAAKTAGKNRVHSCEPAAVSRCRLSADHVRKAIDEDRLCVYYQPVFLASGRISGFEALARIQDASGNLITPERFIDIAEKSSLIVPLGGAVLRKACRQAAMWEKQAGAGLVTSVNVSSRQFANPNFFGEVLAALSDFHLPEPLLELEITESVLLKDLSGAIEQIRILRRRGVRIALDDFGTGYSALSLVHRLPIDVIKIDQSFVQDLDRDGSGRHIVKAILSLTSSLELQSVAEGVEHLSQLNILMALGCGAFQGYAFGRPMPAPIVEARLPGWLSDARHITDRFDVSHSG